MVLIDNWLKILNHQFCKHSITEIKHEIRLGIPIITVKSI